MKGIEAFLIPYIISQLVAVSILLVAWKNTTWGRILLSFLFFWAACTNMYLGLTSPASYLEYAIYAVPLYQNVIMGWFSHHITTVILLISTGQLLISIGMLLKGMWLKLAGIGSIAFLLAIAPFMVGSAFPFSIIVSIAVWMIIRKDGLTYVWKNKIFNRLYGKSYADNSHSSD